MTSVLGWQVLASLPHSVVCESSTGGSVESPAADLLQNPVQVEQDQPSEEDRNQRQGRNLEAGLTESRPFIHHPPSVRWSGVARSTTERVILRTAWTPIPNTQSALHPFGRKISRESQYLRKPTTLDEVKPSNIRKRNFGATFLDAVDKENAEKISDINDLPATVNKSPSVKPWDDRSEDEGNEREGPANKTDVKGDRVRGAIIRGLPRLGVKSSPLTGEAPDQPRGRVRLRGSFRGIYQAGLTTRKPRLEDDLPQRPDKRERNRNLRIRRPFISVLETNKTTTRRPLATSTPVTTSKSNDDDRTPALSSTKLASTTEKIINLKGIVKEYKEIVRTSSTSSPVSSTQNTNSVKSDEILDVNEATTISESTTRTISLVSSSSINNVSTSTKPSARLSETLPNEDSSENVITTPDSRFDEKLAVASSSKSLKQSIQSAVPSPPASLTVTESKESAGSDIKQSKTQSQQVPSLFQIDTTTRNTIERERPREELQKDLLEAIRRKISRNKATQFTSNQAENEGRNLISSTKPPFFRPIIPSRKNAENTSESRVQIFLNLPNKKQNGSSVKIPNISHLRDKIERLNEAITEGLKLERLREEEEAAIEKDWQREESSQKTVETKSSSVKIISQSSDEKQNKEVIRKQLFTSRGEQATGIKNQFDETTTTTVSSLSSSPSTTPLPTTRSTATTTRKSTSVKSSKPVIKDSKSRKKKLFSEHPSSHFRPDNWTSDFIPMPKSNLPPKEEVRHFVVTPRQSLHTPDNHQAGGNASNSKSVNKEADGEKDAIASTAIYVVGVIAVIPVAGLVAWVVRTVLRRKGLAGSESSSETGLNRPITEDDSLQISGRAGLSFTGHGFDSIAEAPENIPKAGDSPDMLGSVWEFPRSRLRLQTVLGEGNFGKVWKAEADDICGYDGTILVAVKTVKENSAQKEVDDLIQEMKIMQEIGSHPNVVTILGVCTEQEPYLCVMEYVMYGKLLTHLREHRMKQSSFFNFSKDGGEVGEALTSKDLTKFAYGVAKGMEYLVSKGIIHRDLAARNILVDHTKNTKISDFGLSRNLRDLGSEMYEQKTKGALPIRWMAPESLYFSVFTPKSDVWGFGILMWEIVTLGSTPYPGMGAREVMRKVRDGYRLERPGHCHPDLYHIIQKCWAGDMNKRPDFSELRKELAKLLEDQHGYIDLQNIPENKYYSMDKNPDEDEKL